MKTQFKYDLKKSIIFFLIVLLVPFTANAQSAPVSSELHGEWFFERAEAQERPLNSNKSYNKQAISKNEFAQKNYFSQIPVQISFVDDFLTEVTNAFGSSQIIAVIVDGNTLEFRQQESENRIPPTLENIDEFPTNASYVNFNASGNRLSVQYNYVYRSGSGDNDFTEGILTIYYIK